ncbi:unnamed protein product [Strongylus vulgaris]|uniref:Conserved oligomeric Golgi complex subunit 7 n=1 Tax=Strongylus vulgaris TaxID=40348 RepID=A0A3P7JHF8_STRVU|nr:unnamed protein product [Strongylus vulgaris]
MVEFISIFRRISINRLREFTADFPSVQLIIDALYKELEFVFTHHHKVLRRFLNDDATSIVLSEAIQQGLSEINLTESFAGILTSDENPIESLQKVSQFVANRSDSSVPGLSAISQHLRAKIIRDLADPFRSALLSYILSKINALDLNSGSFRARVESLKTAIAELLHLLTDVFVHSEALFGHDVKNVVQQPIDKSTTSKGPQVSNLPAFSTAPHEYITTVGQELLQLFHLWEQFFLDDNVVHSFYVALKKKFEGDDLFKKTVSDVANNVITEFVTSVGDPSSYSKDVARQFHADTVFLKDAFEDLRTGNVEQLSALEAVLKSRYAA